MSWKRFAMRFRIAALSAMLVVLVPSQASASIVSYALMDSGPVAPEGVVDHIVEVIPQSAVMLGNVPTSSWTYGCSATSAGMIFGYYDRTGYLNVYAGSFNGGMAPLSDLGGNHAGVPADGKGCSIIATEHGYDGRTTPGHVDDYWISYSSAGPDPWTVAGGGSGVEHAWASCTADYMGTNQWKWDFTGSDGVIDFNIDGSTALWSYSSATKLYDYIPPASAGLPQTALCHGLRLFSESRGYSVEIDGLGNSWNYTQKTDNQYAGGFSFADYMAEIDAGYPVMIQVTGHSMVGVGYDITSQVVYLHDTWGDYVASMTWGGQYSGMDLQAITVIHLDPAGVIPAPGALLLCVLGAGLVGICSRSRWGE